MLRVRSSPCLRDVLPLVPPPPFHSGRVARSSSSSTECVAGTVASILLQLAQDVPQQEEVLQRVGRSIEQELVLESALHVSTMQRLECVQRLGAALQKEPGLLGVAGDDCNRHLLPAFSASSSPSSSDEDDADDDGARNDAALCYATPPDMSDEEEELQMRSSVRAAATPARLATCRATMTADLELDSLQQRAVTALDLFTHRERRRRHRRYVNRALRRLRCPRSAGSLKPVSSLVSVHVRGLWANLWPASHGARAATSVKQREA